MKDFTLIAHYTKLSAYIKIGESSLLISYKLDGEESKWEELDKFPLELKDTLINIVEELILANDFVDIPDCYITKICFY